MDRTGDPVRRYTRDAFHHLSRSIVCATLSLALLAPAIGLAQTDLPSDDRVRIREARRIMARFGDELWPGWSGAPNAILLVTPDTEFLLFHPSPSEDFTFIGHDDLLQSDVYCRDRVFNVRLLATFPAVGGISTVVIGQPKNTDASHSSRWVMTLLHEHFHQWQQSQEDYYPAVNALGLSRGDTTGMWMLNYPFPYDDPAIDDLYMALSRSVKAVLGGDGKRGLPDRVATYEQARAALVARLEPDDYTYLSFQLWQEGVARYTEYAMARAAGASYRPTAEFAALADYRPFDEDAADTWKHIITRLGGASLKTERRTAFYQLGAAEAVLLDRLNPTWRDRYFTEKFYLEKYRR